MPPLLARIGLGCALPALGLAPALACPTNNAASIMPGGDVRIGNNTTIVQSRRVDGTQVEISLGDRASNGVASIKSGDGARVGDRTVVVQTGCVDGAQIDVVVGTGGHASNGKAPAPSRRARGDGGPDAARDCWRSAMVRIAPGVGAEPTLPGNDAQAVDIRPGCTPAADKTR